MEIDLYFKSTQLLEKLANSLYDRDITNTNPVCFSMNEIKIVEGFINDLITELKQ